VTLTLPASWYGDPEIHERERHAIWGREWLAYAPLDHLTRPGQYVADTVAEWPILVAVSPDGALTGFHNVCAHRGGPIAWDGRGILGNLVCRYHGWAYGWDGALKSARDFGDQPEGLALPSVRVERWRNLVFVSLDPDTPPLLDTLGTLDQQVAAFPMESFAFTHEMTRLLACNWKTYADNYLEGYHIPLLHPELDAEIDAKQYRVDVVPEDAYCIHSAPPRDESLNAGRWVFRYPNLALNVYRDGMNVERILPDGPDRTRVVNQYFFADPDDPAVEETLKLSALTLDQDQQICEAVQRSLRAGVYDRGPLSPKHEGGLAWFQRMVATAVESA
jgi:choline monooxygenase